MLKGATRPPDLPLEASFLRKLESLALVSRKLAGGGLRGERKSQRIGNGVAFSTHRAYTPGDDFRFVDWKAFARSDRLFIKQYEEESDLSVHLLLDCSASMGHGDGETFSYAKQLAAALGYVALLNLDRVSVQPFSRVPLPRLSPQRGRNRALVLLRYLSALEPGGGTDLSAAARSVCAHENQRGLSFVLSDGFDAQDLLAGVDLLRVARLAPVVLLLRGAEESAPRQTGELELIDSETGEQRTLLVTDGLLARYRALTQKHFTALGSALAQRRVPALELDVRVPLERAVLDLLRRGGVVR